MWRSGSVRIFLGGRTLTSELLSGAQRRDASNIARSFAGLRVGPSPTATNIQAGSNHRLSVRLRVGVQGYGWNDSSLSLGKSHRSLCFSSCFSTLSFNPDHGKGFTGIVPTYSSCRPNTPGESAFGGIGIIQSFCTAAKPAVAEREIQPAVVTENTVQSQRSAESDPWLLRNLVVTTCINKQPERPQGMTFNVGYMDTGGDWHESKKRATPTVLAIPGQPGSHEDMLPVVRPLHEDGYRVVVVNMPCYEFSKGLTDDDEYLFKNSSSDLAEFVYNFMEVLEMSRTDLVVTHSAGSIPLLILSATTDMVNAGMIICTPSGHVPSRVSRPMWFIKSIVAIWATPSGRAFISWFLPKFNNVVKWLNTDDPCQLMASAKFGAHSNFEFMKTIAAKCNEKQMPLVYFASKNDRLVELDLTFAWGKMLGLEKEQFDVYSAEYEKIKDGNGRGLGYRKGVLLTKGGHYPQRKEAALPVLVKEARALMAHATKNN